VRAARDDEDLRGRLERALRHEAALLALASVDDQAFPDRLRRIVQVDATAMEVARVSFWSLTDEPPAIACDALYLADSGRFEGGAVLEASAFPAYFEALRAGTPIAATDAHTDPRTREFSAGYLTPNRIGAMLDVPVYVRGRLVGVVCHEHVGGPRDWSEHEQLFAMAIGQLVALAIEARSREAAEQAVRDSESRFRSMVEASPLPMLVTRFPDGRVLYGNRAVSQVSGVPYEQVVGALAPNFYANSQDRIGLMAELSSHGVVRNREIQFRRHDGSTYWALVSLVKIEYAAQQAIICAFLDLTEQKQLEERLRVMALHDPLTGLANRALFFDLLRNEFARARRDPNYRFGVLYLDLDDFKQVNDGWGHDVGDRVLVTVASRLRACLRATDTAARLGGDEFTILLANLDEAGEAAAVAARLGDALCAPIPIGRDTVMVSGSIGVAVGDGRLADPEELLRRADDAMYRSKGRAAGGVELAD